MSEEKKIDGQNTKAAELPEKDLENVAGGQGILVTTSRSNIRNNDQTAPSPLPTGPKGV